MKQNQAGFTFIEILVAMTLLGIVLLGVARLNVVLARQFHALTGVAARDGIAAQQINQFAVLNFDSLPGKAGTTVVTTPPMPYTRVVTVANAGPKLRVITIIITPTNTMLRPDTLTIERSKPGGNPFNKKP